MTYTEEATSKFVNAGGVKLHYHDVGAGEPVICLHGGGPGAAGWSNFSKNIDAIASEFRMLIIDMPQFGRSEMVVNETEGRLSFTARIVAAFMDELGIEQADFIGNSIGAQSIMRLCIDSPERVKKHIAVGNNAAAPLSFFQPRPQEGIKLIIDYYNDEGPSMEKMERILRTLVYDQRHISPEIVKERYEMSARPETVELWTKHHPPREEVAHELRKVEAETLMIWGSEDRFSSLDSGLIQLKLLQNSRLHIFPRCGHWAQIERADEFNELSLAFLKR
ncbi:alpha/beta fold hydrolase [Lentisalinibacter orientalis]|uniref:alpha/beta fold hydrolase n=1 Tax=Lentisalinibacter orientalis TaxID=2992241 RepID=UPI00386A07F9